MPDNPDRTDNELMQMLAAGDRTAFEPLVVRHGPACRRLARALVGNPEGADDVLQKAFVAAYRGAGNFRGDASVKTWLLTITRNTAYRHRKQNQKHDDGVPLLELGLGAGWGGDDPETAAIRAQQRDVLNRALGSLAEEEREILTLRDLEQMTGPETAELLGLSLAAMKSRLHRARLRLAAALRNEGGAHGGA